MEITSAARARRATAALAAVVLAASIPLGACTRTTTTQPTSAKTVNAITGGSAPTRPMPHRSRGSHDRAHPRRGGSGHGKHGGQGTGPATVGRTGAPPPPPISGAVTFVGDSVGVDTTPYLEQVVPGAHSYSMVNRSWGEGEQLIQTLASQGALGPIVVVELGLNGPITNGDFAQMMSILHGIKRVVFLNIRLPVGAYGPGTDWWGSQNNAVIASQVPLYHNALLANWYADSAGHTDWFASDGIHLSGLGGAAMAELIRQYV